jgi:hypothetical protein
MGDLDQVLEFEISSPVRPLSMIPYYSDSHVNLVFLLERVKRNPSTTSMQIASLIRFFVSIVTASRDLQRHSPLETLSSLTTTKPPSFQK